MEKMLDVNNLPTVGYCISNELRDEQIKINIQKVKERFTPVAQDFKMPEPIAIVCFGPSLKNTWKSLKAFNYIITCSGAHKFLLEKGFKPKDFKKWYHNELDPREHKIKLLGQPQPEIEYLIASTIHPKYIDHLRDNGANNIKLWHIFANEAEGRSVLPRGESLICGGSSVGLRCFNLARLMGFTDFHIFGMDGSIEAGNTHTTEHPNAPPEKGQKPIEVNGKTFITTASMAFCAKETTKELDQLPDVKFKFYGEGLTQEIMKTYKPNHVMNVPVSLEKPELISKEYIELNRKMHQDHPTYGMGGARHAKTVTDLYKTLITPENPYVKVLDFGCGKGQLAKALPFAINEYDPAVPGKEESPEPADLVVSTDVLEHIEPDKLMFVLDELRRLVKNIGYFVISVRPAVKTYANGVNAHLLIKDKDWWNKKLSKYFDVGTIIENEKEKEIQVLVGKKQQKQGNSGVVMEVEFEGKKVKFDVPNDTIKWRVNTIFNKEPITIEWIRSMKAGEKLLDIGANMGGYSMLAASKGVLVTSFEPEAENFALLQRNIVLNGFENVTAYCAGFTDTPGMDVMTLSQQGAGGSCHRFGEKAGKLKQGVIGFRLDQIAEHPDHIKIDVDGIEPKIINGSFKSASLESGRSISPVKKMAEVRHWIDNKKIQTILVEVNTNLPEHRDMVDKICSFGYRYDQKQVNAAMRKEGGFKGCAEYLFKSTYFFPPELEEELEEVEEVQIEHAHNIVDMEAGAQNSANADDYKPQVMLSVVVGEVTDAFSKYEFFVSNHVIKAVKEAGVYSEPFPYLFIKNIFPVATYNEMIANLPKWEQYDEIEKSRGTKNYPLRYTCTPKTIFWNYVFEELKKPEVVSALLEEFGVKTTDFPEGLETDVLLIRDKPGYAITPHTDTPRKVVTVLFYLSGPQHSKDDAGTTIFEPKEPGFTCDKGIHYSFANFLPVFTAPYAPNTALIFARTNNSFHGVFPTNQERDVLLMNINRATPKKNGKTK